MRSPTRLFLYIYLLLLSPQTTNKPSKSIFPPSSGKFDITSKEPATHKTAIKHAVDAVDTLFCMMMGNANATSVTARKKTSKKANKDILRAYTNTPPRPPWDKPVQLKCFPGELKKTNAKPPERTLECIADTQYILMKMLDFLQNNTSSNFQEVLEYIHWLSTIKEPLSKHFKLLFDLFSTQRSGSIFSTTRSGSIFSTTKSGSTSGTTPSRQTPSGSVIRKTAQP